MIESVNQFWRDSKPLNRNKIWFIIAIFCNWKSQKGESSPLLSITFPTLNICLTTRNFVMNFLSLCLIRKTMDIYKDYTIVCYIFSEPNPFQIKHRKNCECCPGHYLIVNHYSSMSWFKFRNLSEMVNCVTNSLNHS